MEALRPVARRSLSDHVFEQLRERIVAGAFAPGHALPGERNLCESLGVNRGPLREALKRLDQAGLITIRHGGSTLVRDYREGAGLDLLPDLLRTASGDWDPEVVLAVLEMRSALAPDVARLAAERAGPEDLLPLDARVGDMQAAREDLVELQRLSLAFWAELVRASGNVAYRLAFNSLREAYARAMDLLRDVMRDEFEDVAHYASLARAVGAGEAEEAETAARHLVRRGEARIKAALSGMAS
ncbi:MAG: FadR family transcriptional regulator [Myxococcales bacterium]|nr:FadR family transcriptional regulator [Myxococcales bacterium]